MKTKITLLITALLFLMALVFTMPNYLASLTAQTEAQLMIHTGGYALLFIVIYTISYFVMMTKIENLIDQLQESK